MTKFNPFMLKYVLSEDLPKQLLSCTDIKEVRFEATAAPENPSVFFSNIPATDIEGYAKFCEEVVRCEILFIDRNNNNKTRVYYLFFRNARQDRPDLGANRYTFAKPSSVEFGFVDSSKKYVSLYKKHYSNWITTPDLTASSPDEMKLLTKSIEYDIINEIIKDLNKIEGTQVALKPTNNGMAVLPAKAQPAAAAAQTISSDIANIASKIVGIADQLYK